MKTVCSIQPFLLLLNDNYLPNIEANSEKVMNYENVLKELGKIDCKLKCINSLSYIEVCSVR